VRWTYTLAAALAVIAAIAISAHCSTTTLEFSRYNIEWNGTSAFADQARESGAIFISDWSGIEGDGDAMLLVIAPAGGFLPGELSSLRQFLTRGNTVLIAAEDDAARPLLEGIGAGMAVTAVNVSSADVEYDDPRMVIGYVQRDDPLTANTSTLLLNEAGAISGGTSLVSTSLLSWVDTNGNQRPDTGETITRYPALSRSETGGGVVYLLSDPSVFINAMTDRASVRDNRQFIANILGSGTVYLDESHSRIGASDGPLLVMNAVKNTMVIKITALVGIILIVACAYRRRWW
jgi:hypothetical protein